MTSTSKDNELPAAEFPVPSSVDLLDGPEEFSVPQCLHSLIRDSLVTEFPVNTCTEGALRLSADERRDMLCAPESPWRRSVWWSPDALPALERAINAGEHVSSRNLVSRLTTCSLPCQNISRLRASEVPHGDLRVPSLHGEFSARTHHGDCKEVPLRADKKSSCQYRLHNFSVACNDLTNVFGSELLRSLTSLQLYGNPITNLASLFIDPPALQFLGLGKLRMSDADLRHLTLVLQECLPTLRVLDVCDNNICDCDSFVELVTSVPNLRAVTLSGNPAFLASGYYTALLDDSGRLRILDGEEMTDEVWASLEQQLNPPQNSPASSVNVKKKKSGGGKRKSARMSFRRPAPDLDEVRFKPSLTCALVRITGLFHLPFVPKEKLPGLEIVAIFHWAGDRDCSAMFNKLLAPPAKRNKGKKGKPEELAELEELEEGNPDLTCGLCPQEATITERSDVTVLDVPLEWYCTDLCALRDAMLSNMSVEIVHREKWTPKKPSKREKKTVGKEKKFKNDEMQTKGKEKSKGEKDMAHTSNKDREKDENVANEKAGKGRSKKNAKSKAKNKKDVPTHEDTDKAKSAEPDSRYGEAAASAAEEVDAPPPEVRMGALKLPLRALLRPRGPLLLHGTLSSGGHAAVAQPTQLHWSSAIDSIQNEKKLKKAEEKRAAKEAAKIQRHDGKKKKGASVKSNPTRHRSPPLAEEPHPQIECFFSVELYKMPSLKLASTLELASLPIDDLEGVRVDC